MLGHTKWTSCLQDVDSKYAGESLADSPEATVSTHGQQAVDLLNLVLLVY